MLWVQIVDVAGLTLFVYGGVCVCMYFLWHHRWMGIGFCTSTIYILWVRFLSLPLWYSPCPFFELPFALFYARFPSSTQLWILFWLYVCEYLTIFKIWWRCFIEMILVCVCVCSFSFSSLSLANNNKPRNKKRRDSIKREKKYMEKTTSTIMPPPPMKMWRKNWKKIKNEK